MSVCGKLSNEKGSAYIEVNWIVRVIGCILLKSDTELCNGRCSREGSFACYVRMQSKTIFLPEFFLFHDP